MPHKEPNYTSCCDLMDSAEPENSNKFVRLRNACGVGMGEAAHMFSIELGEYLQIERGEIAFKDWRRCMEIMCVLSNKPFELIEQV